MAQQSQDSAIYDAVELLTDNGFDGVAEAAPVLMNAAMVAERGEYLRTRPCERSEDRRGIVRYLGRDFENQRTVERHLGQSEAPPLWILALG